MAHNGESGFQRSESTLIALENFWRVPLPVSFRRLYHEYQSPYLAPCDFFTAEAIVRGAGRAYGLVPQFLPFGRAVDESGLYGFYVTPENETDSLPIILWDEEELFFQPVASDFTSFLRICLLTGRYETEEQLDDCEQMADTEAAALVARLNLGRELTTDSIPRNDTELRERIARIDAHEASCLCHLGCMRRAGGNEERALDYYHRATEVAPWFGDSYYLVADIYRERGNLARAVQGYWAVAQRLLPLCTRTWLWDLGYEHPEADIYEVAADGLAQHESEADESMKASPLWGAVVDRDPYDPECREEVGRILLEQNDVRGAEREFLNALSLCGMERGRQPERLYEALIHLYEREGRKRDVELSRFDRALLRAVT